jgi:hypothetical protein
MVTNLRLRAKLCLTVIICNALKNNFYIFLVLFDKKKKTELILYHSRQMAGYEVYRVE